ncbi:GNAT family N-acetyltransferase [Stackebrandtia nassauensis]|uniref:GCN5-related N-acetyltransferase n=1 Tax=Stackebrandtia nassauensis (strain DSM 44728 / CIP 108903 / NRRL B-16338 / NBRC 102104 / LLR-40K-21) TaxID=446470 RepID=D3PZM9_STANL|nr:GNAT family protein [Stackebrandtia nassauensis]ADD43566.1 GCN5-related N-acetyltransferase [Stackebrandtia nassauensis DSM 44728]
MTSTWPKRLHIRPLTTADARDIADWRYGGDWSIYDSRPEDGLLQAADGYWAVTGAEDGSLVGFCCLGFDARVPGLVKAEGVEDLGVGMRPRFTGSGHGPAFAAAVVAFARAHSGKPRLRAVVQSWNTRSLRLFQSLGFVEDGVHVCVEGGREVEYTVLVCG